MCRFIIFISFFLISLSSLSEQFCDAPSVKDGNFNVDNMNDENPIKFLGMIANVFSWNLSKDDKCLHSEAVLQALLSLDTHESLKWKNKKNNTANNIQLLPIRLNPLAAEM